MTALAIRLPELLPLLRPRLGASLRRAKLRPEPMSRRKPLALRLAAAEPVGVAWSTAQDGKLQWLWAASPALLLRQLARQMAAEVLSFSEAGHGLGILLRVAADELDARGATDTSRILALREPLRPWVKLHWCGSPEQLRLGEGEFASGYVNAFLDWDAAIEPHRQPEVPSYQWPAFRRSVALD